MKLEAEGEFSSIDADKQSFERESEREHGENERETLSANELYCEPYLIAYRRFEKNASDPGRELPSRCAASVLRNLGEAKIIELINEKSRLPSHTCDFIFVL